jgi:hypothetical protein
MGGHNGGQFLNYEKWSKIAGQENFFDLKKWVYLESRKYVRS